MHFGTRAFLFASFLIPAYAASNAAVVYSENAAWIENLAVRRSNGYILPAVATSPLLYQVNPATGKHDLVYDFSDYGNGITTIADVGPDMFVVNTMYCNITQLSCTKGTGITWRVDFRAQNHNKHGQYDQKNHRQGRVAEVTQLVKGPDPRSLLNGAAALNPHTVLMVDQNLGGIWSVDVFQGNARLLFTDPSMSDPNHSGMGVNGIRVRGSTLYYNNPSRGTFAKIPIDPDTGERRGDATIIASGLSPDDFEIDEQKGYAYISAGDQSALLKLSLKDGTHEAIVFGLAAPTTARWKEYGKSLYIATTGGYKQWTSGHPTVPAIVYEAAI